MPQGKCPLVVVVLFLKIHMQNTSWRATPYMLPLKKTATKSINERFCIEYFKRNLQGVLDII